MTFDRPGGQAVAPAVRTRSLDERRRDSARRYVGNTDVSPALTALVELAARALDFPIAMLDIVDDAHQYVLVRSGGDDRIAVVSDRFDTICDAVVRLDRPCAVDDATEPVDEPSLTLCADTTLVRERALRWGIRSVVAIPLHGREGLTIGALCLLDEHPHPIGLQMIETLTGFAQVVESELEARRSNVRHPNHSTVHDVSRGLEAGEFVPYFQPLIELQTNRIIGFEALARWNHPERGVLPPEDFLADIESTDVIIDVDLAMLTAALAAFGEWPAQESPFMVGVNISGQHLAHREGADRIIDIVAASGVPFGSVALEVTESTVVLDTDGLARFVKTLQDRGLFVLIDDAGTGWSSLDRLVALPVAGFKIDQSITSRTGTVAGDAMLRSLATFGRTMDQKVVAEGIETEAQRRASISAGCDFGQGFLWSRPVPAADVPSMLAAALVQPASLSVAGPSGVAPPSSDQSVPVSSDGSDCTSDFAP